MPLSHYFLIIHHVQYFGWLDRTDIIAVLSHVDVVRSPMGASKVVKIAKMAIFTTLINS